MTSHRKGTKNLLAVGCALVDWFTTCRGRMLDIGWVALTWFSPASNGICTCPSVIFGDGI